MKILSDFGYDDIIECIQEGCDDSSKSPGLQLELFMKIQANVEILKQHKYRRWRGSDGFYRTYLPGKEGERRRLVKKKTKKALDDEIIAYYGKSPPEVLTFDDIYKRYRNFKDEFVSHNTIVRYESDYKRFIEGTEFKNKPLSELTKDEIMLFVIRNVKEKKLGKKATKTLFNTLKSVFEYARRNEIIPKNPIEDVYPKEFYKSCTDSKRTRAKTFLNEEEISIVLKQIREDRKKQPSYMPGYAVELALFTGMRVGELAALSWEDITDTHILITKSEKCDRKEKTYHISTTKNGRERAFPITDEIKAILGSLKEVQVTNKLDNGWLFPRPPNEGDGCGRIHANMISSCLKNKCRSAGIEERGIHALRRTFNSRLRANGVPTKACAALIGNTEIVNSLYYEFDVSTDKYKKDFASLVDKQPSKGT